MPSSVAQARRFEDVLDSASQDSPYLFDKIFSTDGFWARRLSKAKFKMLKGLDSEIRAILRPGERVHYLSWGIRSSLLEHYALGWAMYYMNRFAFVFTTQRILLIQVSPRNKPLHLRSQIEYTAIRAVKRRFTGVLKLVFRDGKSTTFEGMPRRDRKHAQELVSRLVARAQEAGLDAGAASRHQHLCPHCYAALTGFPETCGSCAGGLKSPRKAALLSLLFPGLGDFYIGHRKLALMEMAVAALIWVGVMMPVEGEPVSMPALLIAGAIVFLFMHGIDALFTWTIARKGVYPGAPAPAGALARA